MTRQMNNGINGNTLNSAFCFLRRDQLFPGAFGRSLSQRRFFRFRTLFRRLAIHYFEEKTIWWRTRSAQMGPFPTTLKHTFCIRQAGTHLWNWITTRRFVLHFLTNMVSARVLIDRNLAGNTVPGSNEINNFIEKSLFTKWPTSLRNV